MKIVRSLGILLMLLSQVPALSSECKHRPDVIGACYLIHGRAEYYNGTPSLRIWRVGTKRLYGVLTDDKSGVPQKLQGALQEFDHSVYGDYEVCPLTREKQGSMTMVCIEGAKNLVVTDYGTTKPVKRKESGIKAHR